MGNALRESKERRRIIFLGLGDAALYTISQLYDRALALHIDIVAVTPRPALDSGQDVGLRLTNLALMREYGKSAEYHRFPQLDGVTILHGLATAVDAVHKTVTVRLADGTVTEEQFSLLVVCTGVQNSFWRPNSVDTLETRNRELQRNVGRVAGAGTVAVIGGGAAGISACWSIKERHPGKQVHFFFSGAECLPRYHANARANVIRRLEKLGVVCHPHHRAVAPEGCNGLAEDRVVFTPDSPSEWFDADLVVWALGPTGPNTGFLPPGWLSQGGFVKVDKHLRVLGHADIFAVGDCADSDPDRSSARNYGWKVLAKNIELCLSGVTEGPRLQVFKPEPLRWGSVYLSAVDSRMILTLPGGSLTAVPGWVVRYLFIRIVNFMIMLRARPRDPPDQPDRELDTVLREYD